MLKEISTKQMIKIMFGFFGLGVIIVGGIMNVEVVVYTGGVLLLINAFLYMKNR